MCSDDSDVLAASTIFRPRDTIRRLDARGPRISAGVTPVLVTSTIFEAEWLQKIFEAPQLGNGVRDSQTASIPPITTGDGARLTMPKAVEDYHTAGPMKNGAPVRPERRFPPLSGVLLARQRPLKCRHPGSPQRVPLRLTMSLRGNEPIRMARMSDVPVLPVAIRRRGLREPCRVTDRAEIDRSRVHMVADGLQPLQDGLPLFPIELPQERPQPLNEGILEQRLAVRLRNEEAVQPYVQCFGNLLERAETRRHLSALDAREVRSAHLRARLQLALCHAPRLSQLANPLADVFDRLLIRELARHRFRRHLLLWRRLRDQILHSLR